MARFGTMSPPISSPSTAHNGLRQTARLPRDSDGVGNALRHIFGGGQAVPSEFNALLNRLKDN